MTPALPHRNAARASTVHASHDMQPRGNDDTGKRRYVCASCRVGSTWPEAAKACGQVAAVERTAATPRFTATRELWPQRFRPFGPPRPCKVCGESWQPQVGQHNTEACGPTCQRVARCKRVNAARDERTRASEARRGRERREAASDAAE